MKHLLALLRSFFDPYVGSGMGTDGWMDSFGFGVITHQQVLDFILMPMNYDLQVIQQIEFNDMIRRSNYSFEMHNNNLRLFPIPDGSLIKCILNIFLNSERSSASFVVGGSSTITNI